MKLPIAFTVLTAGLFLPLPALAEWVYVASDKFTQTYIQTDSIVYEGNIVRFVKRDKNRRPDPGGAIDSLNFNGFNCTTGEAIAYRAVGFDENRQMVYDHGGEPLVFPPPPENSRGGDIYKFVCRL